MIPKCQDCGAEVGVSLGLPVHVTFYNGDEDACVANVSVDTAELDDEFYVTCDCEGAAQAHLTDEDANRLVAMLGVVGRQCAPECDTVVAFADFVEDAR